MTHTANLSGLPETVSVIKIFYAFLLFSRYCTGYIS